MTIGKIPVKFYLVQKRNYRIEEKKDVARVRNIR